jgi:DNA-binding MarR family transcriptional regulator
VRAAEAVRHVERAGDGLTPALRWLLLGLALMADERGEARPTRAALARQYGRSATATDDAVNRLSALGLVEVERAPRRRQRISLVSVHRGR